MPYRVVVVPDKFKGTLTSPEAAKAIEQGWLRSRSRDRLDLVPMSDGGDGFGETLSFHCGGERRRVKTTNAAGESIWAPWWWLPRTRTAVIETAQIIGLAQLPKGKFHPFDLDSFGLGTLLKKVFATRPDACLIGLGGSATNDGGMGMARGLGWRFHDSSGLEVSDWTGLRDLVEITSPESRQQLPRVTVAVDVRNRLLGKTGASKVYGPQKGLRDEDMPLSEACLAELAKCFGRHSGRNEAKRDGAGAAGGLGFGCFAFLEGEAQSGFDVFASQAGLEKRLAKADLVITGEGSIDSSSVMGKGVGAVASLCRELGVPCIGMGGVLGRGPKIRREFAAVHQIVGTVADEARAFSRPKESLALLAENVAATWQP